MATANAATTFLENRLLNFLFKGNAAQGGVTFGSPGDNIFVGLATAVTNFDGTTGESGDPAITEAAYTSYGRVQVQSSKWTLTAESANTQTCKNNESINFDASTGGGSATITHVFIATHQTNSLDVVGANGNVLFIGALDNNKTIDTGDIFRINTNNLTIELK